MNKKRILIISLISSALIILLAFPSLKEEPIDLESPLGSWMLEDYIKLNAITCKNLSDNEINLNLQVKDSEDKIIAEEEFLVSPLNSQSIGLQKFHKEGTINKYDIFFANQDDLNKENNSEFISCELAFIENPDLTKLNESTLLLNKKESLDRSNISNSTSFGLKATATEEPIATPTPSGPGYLTCRGSFCELQDGFGINTCNNSSACEHTKCEKANYGGVSGYKCIKVSGSGQNECSEHGDCSKRVCEKNDQNQFVCKVKPGIGPDECQNSEDCIGTKCVQGYSTIGWRQCKPDPTTTVKACKDRDSCLHKLSYCEGKQCKQTKNGDSVDPSKKQCNIDNGNSDCIDKPENPHHYACEEQVCVRKAGVGQNSCSNHIDCLNPGPRHRKCVTEGGSVLCKIISGEGTNECQNENECPEAGSSKCEYREGLNYCVFSSDRGTKECQDIRDCVGSNSGTKCFKDPENGLSKCIEDVRSKKKLCAHDNDCNNLATTSTTATTSAQKNNTFNNLTMKSSDPSGTIFGDSKSQILLEIFHDTDCGMCRYTFNEMIRPLLENREAKIIFKDFPLIKNQESIEKAKALHCFAKQNSYLKLLSDLYEKNSHINNKSGFQSTAQKYGLSLNDFNACMDAKDTQDSVNKIIEEGRAKNIDGVPSIYLNNIQIGGAMDYNKFSEILKSQKTK